MILDNALQEAIHDYGPLLEGWYVDPTPESPQVEERAAFPWNAQAYPPRMLWLNRGVQICTDGRDHNVYDADRGGKMYCRDHYRYGDIFCNVRHTHGDRSYEDWMILGYYPIDLEPRRGWVGNKEVVTYLAEQYPDFYMFITAYDYNHSVDFQRDWRNIRYFLSPNTSSFESPEWQTYQTHRTLFGIDTAQLLPMPASEKLQLVLQTLHNGGVCEVCNSRSYSLEYTLDTRQYVESAMVSFRELLRFSDEPGPVAELQQPPEEEEEYVYILDGLDEYGAQPGCNCQECHELRQEEYDNEYAGS